MKEIQVCTIEGSHPFPRGDDNEFTKFENSFLQNNWANFNQTWHEVSEKDSSLFKWTAMPFSKGDNNEIAKIH